MIDITIEQIDLIKHAIGWDNISSRHKIFNSYRNRYFCIIGEEKHKQWADLEEKGYAKSFYVDSTMVLFMVTRKAIEFLSDLFKIKINQDKEDIIT